MATIEISNELYRKLMVRAQSEGFDSLSPYIEMVAGMTDQTQAVPTPLRSRLELDLLNLLYGRQYVPPAELAKSLAIDDTKVRYLLEHLASHSLVWISESPGIPTKISVQDAGNRLLLDNGIR